MQRVFPPRTMQGSVCLEALQLTDWPLEQALSCDPAVIKWTHYPSDLDQASAQEHVQRSLHRAAQGLVQRYAIRDERGRPLGTCGIGGLDQMPRLFYAVLAEHRNRGVATAATSMLADWTLRNGADQVALETIAGNIASERVAIRAGFMVQEVVDDEHRGQPVAIKRWAKRNDALSRP